jgi:hypothetical protein
MANWHALFPHVDAAGITKLRADLTTEKRKADAAYQDRLATLQRSGANLPANAVATLIATGSDQSFGGYAAGLPFLGSEELDEIRKGLRPLRFDALDVISRGRHNFDHGYVWLTRGVSDRREIDRHGKAYAAARSTLEGRDSPFGEIGVRLALLDEFQHAVRVASFVGRLDDTMVVYRADGRIDLRFFDADVAPTEMVVDAARRAFLNGTPAEVSSPSVMVFEKDRPEVTFVRMSWVDPHDERFRHTPATYGWGLWAPTKAVYAACRGRFDDLGAALAAAGIPVGSKLSIAPDDAEAFILAS